MLKLCFEFDAVLCSFFLFNVLFKDKKCRTGFRRISRKTDRNAFWDRKHIQVIVRFFRWK